MGSYTFNCYSKYLFSTLRMYSFMYGILVSTCKRIYSLGEGSLAYLSFSLISLLVSALKLLMMPSNMIPPSK